ncbi:MAG: signal peptidase I [Candidatus Nomurabacteria bacterium]|jgi:signal peptidase I|nr:signal peptidase I [Candidatus Nomurabacteria bacterium]
MFQKTKKTDVPKVRRASNWQSDILGVLVFVIIIAAGVFIINMVVFRSYAVTGPSMEPTFYTGDRIIVNRLPVTWSSLKGGEYMPQRGEIIVFENPQFKEGDQDKYIVKRVIAFPGERVVVKDCNITIYSDETPKGLNPYDDIDIKPTCVSGAGDTVVPDRQIYVVGDHRDGHYSLDSRNNLGTVPFEKIIGPVSIQLLPVEKFHIF